MKLQIDVTQNDIDMGIPTESDRCPIAQSLMRKGYDYICVGDDSITFDDNSGISWYAVTPETAVSFISYFDSHKSVSPFSFEILAITEEERYAGDEDESE